MEAVKKSQQLGGKLDLGDIRMKISKQKHTLDVSLYILSLCTEYITFPLHI